MDLLVEDAEFVADAVADRRTLEGGQRVQVARGEPAEAAVAQSRFLLARQDLVEILTHRRQRGLCRPLHAKVQQVVAQLRTHQEFGRQVAGHLTAEIQRGLRRRHPTVLHAVTHGQRERPVVVLGPQGRSRPADRIAQVIGDRPLQRLRAHPGAGVLDEVGGPCVIDIGHGQSYSLDWRHRSYARRGAQAVILAAMSALRARN